MFLPTFLTVVVPDVAIVKKQIIYVLVSVFNMIQLVEITRERATKPDAATMERFWVALITPASSSSLPLSSSLGSLFPGVGLNIFCAGVGCGVGCAVVGCEEASEGFDDSVVVGPKEGLIVGLGLGKKNSTPLQLPSQLIELQPGTSADSHRRAKDVAYWNRSCAL